MKPKWMVCLGEAEWSRFTHAGVAEAGVRLLGSVRRGLQMGALGVDEQGRYVQINGDHRIELSQSQVIAAMGKASRQRRAGGTRAGSYRPGGGSPQGSDKPPAPPPVITVRRRKLLRTV